MSACFGWIRDPRMHLSAIVLLLIWLVPRPDPPPEPAPVLSFNEAMGDVLAEWLSADSMRPVRESLMTAGVRAEGPPGAP